MRIFQGCSLERSDLALISFLSAWKWKCEAWSVSCHLLYIIQCVCFLITTTQMTSSQHSPPQKREWRGFVRTVAAADCCTWAAGETAVRRWRKSHTHTHTHTGKVSSSHQLLPQFFCSLCQTCFSHWTFPKQFLWKIKKVNYANVITGEGQ